MRPLDETRQWPFLLLLFFFPVAAAPAGEQDVSRLAQRILRDSGASGGLVVHVGCGDGRLCSALGAGARFLIQGLDRDPANVQRARERILADGRYGPVSIERWRGASLPYADDLVNVIVAEDRGGAPMGELMRVLQPGGVAFVARSGRWVTRVKERPDEIDEWTHFLHDASNNAVAADSQVGPPRRLKWVCGPRWTRSHEFTSSLCAMVSGGGRLFYVFDEGLTGVTSDSIPEKWMLIARDAFNGILLWKRPVPKWGSSGWRNKALRSIPPTVPRCLVADADRVYVTLGYGAPVSALDAATGQTLAVYESTEGTEEIRCLAGVLLASEGSGRILAIDTGTGRTLWDASGKIQRLSLAAQGDRVVYQEGRELVCRGLRDGAERWRAPISSSVSLLVVHQDRVLLLGGTKLQAMSLETGEQLWSVDAPVQRNELFAAGGQAWLWEGGGVVGRDLKSGELSTKLDTSDVFTPGHHLRCYQSKATERFLITPNRGAEFVSVTGDANTENDWIRGACRYGIMPCNGLLYVPPNPCFCYPDVKLTGFYALAPKAAESDAAPDALSSQRLERGIAYGRVEGLARSEPGRGVDWPTYRHDARRSAAASCEVALPVSTSWSAPFDGALTPAVVADHRVYVAVKDRHTLVALSEENGERLWRFIAGGRIDSPPTVSGPRVLFGGADGWVYCLRASDGALVWRFRAAPREERIVAFGQLESPWRVHGAVLVEGGVAYFTAGRSSFLDGGIQLFGVDVETGEVVCETSVDTWARTREDAKDKPFIPGYFMEGARSDILVSEGGFIYLGQEKFDRGLAAQETPYTLPGPDDQTVGMNWANQPFMEEDAEPEKDYEQHQRDWLERTQPLLLQDLRRKFGGYSLGNRQMGRHVLSTSGFLDDSWFNRTYWMYADSWPGYYLAHRAPKTGQLLAVGPDKTYAVQAFPSRNLQSPLFTPGGKGYLLCADKNANEPVLDHRTWGTTKGWGYVRKRPPEWYDWAPVRIRAMVLAGDRLFVAGPPDVVDPDDPMAAFEGRKGARLRAYSADDGKLLAQQNLDSPPVFDGLIAASQKLFLCTTDNRVVCLASP